MKILFLPHAGEPEIRDIPYTDEAFKEQIGDDFSFIGIGRLGDLFAFAFNTNQKRLDVAMCNKNIELFTVFGNAFVCGVGGGEIPKRLLQLFGLEDKEALDK